MSSLLSTTVYKPRHNSPDPTPRTTTLLRGTQTYLTNLLQNKARTHNISPLLHRHLTTSLSSTQTSLALLQLHVLSPSEIATIAYETKQDTFNIDNQLRRDEKNATVRREVQDLRLMELLLKYGELLCRVSPEIEKFINSGLFASKFMTKGDKDVCAFVHAQCEKEVSRVQEYESASEGKQEKMMFPMMRYCNQLEEVGETLGMNVWKTRSLVRLYVDQNCFGDPGMVNYMVGKRQWEGFGRELVRDMGCVGGLLETHAWLRPYSQLVGIAFEKLKQKYFQVLEGRWVDGEGGCGRGRMVVEELLTTVEVWEEDEKIVEKRKADRKKQWASGVC